MENTIKTVNANSMVNFPTFFDNLPYYPTKREEIEIENDCPEATENPELFDEAWAGLLKHTKKNEVHALKALIKQQGITAATELLTAYFDKAWVDEAEQLANFYIHTVAGA